MARTKKISVETKTDDTKTKAVESLLTTLEPKVNVVEWNGITFNVRDRITNVEAIHFTKVISDLCFSENGEYLPEVFEYAVSFATASFFSDFPLPTGLEEQYKLFTFTDLIQEILNRVDSKQYEAIFDATKEKIDYRLKTEVDAVKKQAEEMIASVDTLLTKLNDTFGEFDNKEIKGLVKALSTGKIDEKKIMDAYLKAKK